MHQSHSYSSALLTRQPRVSHWFIHVCVRILLNCTLIIVGTLLDTAVSLWTHWGKKKLDMQHITLIKYKLQNEEKEFRLLQVIQHKWYDIGLLLGVPVTTIDSRKTNEEKCQDVLRMWMEKGSPEYPVEWGGLIKVLWDVEMRTAADELREALEHTL